MDWINYLPILFFIIALLYSMVGFGGGSSYIALLILFQFPLSEVRVLALICNVAVVLLASFHFYRKDLISWKKLFPIILLSIPFAYLGARIKVEDQLYQSIAGVILILASIAIIVRYKKPSTSIENKKNQIGMLSSIGGGIGFISGFIGIGGGIFLSPVLHLLRKGKAVEISAMCSVFILANSLSGIIGHSSNLKHLPFSQTIFLLIAVISGGYIGNRLNISFLKANHIRIMTAILVGYVGLKLLLL